MLPSRQGQHERYGPSWLAGYWNVEPCFDIPQRDKSNWASTSWWLIDRVLVGRCGRFEEGFASYTEDCLPLCVVSLDRKSDRQFESGLASGTHLASFCADIRAFRDTICSPICMTHIGSY